MPFLQLQTDDRGLTMARTKNGTEEKDGNKTHHQQGKDKRKGEGIVT